MKTKKYGLYALCAIFLAVMLLVGCNNNPKPKSNDLTTFKSVEVGAVMDAAGITVADLAPAADFIPATEDGALGGFFLYPALNLVSLTDIIDSMEIDLSSSRSLSLETNVRLYDETIKLKNKSGETSATGSAKIDHLELFLSGETEKLFDMISDFTEPNANPVPLTASVKLSADVSTITEKEGAKTIIPISAYIVLNTQNLSGSAEGSTDLFGGSISGEVKLSTGMISDDVVSGVPVPLLLNIEIKPFELSGKDISDIVVSSAATKAEIAALEKTDPDYNVKVAAEQDAFWGVISEKAWGSKTAEGISVKLVGAYNDNGRIATQEADISKSIITLVLGLLLS